MSSSESHTGNGAPHGSPHFGQRIDHLGESAQQLVTEARSAVQDLFEYVDLQGRVNRHPYGMLGAAAGLGYILGGGLFTPLTARILRFGLRLAALPFMKDELVGLVDAAASSFSGQESSSEDKTPATAQADAGGSGDKSSDIGSKP